MPYLRRNLSEFLEGVVGAESDACFGLAEGVYDSVVAQVGVDGHHREVVLEGGVGSN